MRPIRLFVLLTALPVLSLTAATRAVAEDTWEGMQGLSGTEVYPLRSAVNEHNYHLIVRPPPGYVDNPDAVYPVLYLLDGGALFPMLAGYYNYLRHQLAVPEMIVVGISYGTDDFRAGNARSTDYTAPADERDYWGGAPEFVEVLEREVLPFVENNYRADIEKRVLFGQSIGGQFILYAALNRPDLFAGFIASNPALHRNLAFFLEHPLPPARPDVRVFVASGSNDVERFRTPALAWMNSWGMREDLPWQLRTETIEGYGHFSIVPESFRRGLAFTFENVTQSR